MHRSFVYTGHLGPRFTNLPTEIRTPVGEPFAFQVEAVDRHDPVEGRVTFTTTARLITVERERGAIAFTPTELNRGRHVFPIYAMNARGTMTMAHLTVIVE